jgi:hypothetical protein
MFLVCNISFANSTHFIPGANTGNNPTIIVKTEINPLINNKKISAGDEIGIFSPAGICVGASVWDDTNLAIAVWGDDTETSEIDGIKEGEPFQFRLWNKSEDKEYTAIATFSEPGDSTYTKDAIIILQSLMSITNSPHFNYVSNTGKNSTIILKLDINPKVNGSPLSIGDEVGVFTSTGLCVGAGIWENTNLAITVWGDDSETLEIDGIKSGEKYHYRIWDIHTQKDYHAIATYLSGNSSFEPDDVVIFGSLIQLPEADFNDDGSVGLTDLVLLGSIWGLTSTSSNYEIKYDLNKDGSIGLADLVILGSQWTGSFKLARAVSAASVTLDMSAKRNEATSMFYVNVSTKDATEIDGLAFSLRYDPNLFVFVKDSVTGLGTVSVAKETIAGIIEIASVYSKEKFSGTITLPFKAKDRTSYMNVAMVNAEISLNGVIGSVNDQTHVLKTLPNAFALSQNKPNPFNPTTIIQYAILGDKEVFVCLKIYDSRGTLVRTLVNGAHNPGLYSATWNATDDAGRRISSGIYFYRLDAGSLTQTRKMLFLR